MSHLLFISLFYNYYTPIEQNKKNLKKIWNSVPPDYYQEGIKKNLLQRLWHMGKLKAITSLIDTTEPEHILDVGCASGWILSEIAEKYPKAKCVGIDIYKKAIEHGRKKYKSLNLIHADAHSLPFPKRKFDLVICTEVLEHVLDPQKVLNEIKKVLKPGGIAIIEMDTGNFLFNSTWYLWTRLKGGVWKDAHLHSFNTKKLENLIVKNGFVITKKKIFNYTMAVAFRSELQNPNRSLK